MGVGESALPQPETGAHARAKAGAVSTLLRVHEPVAVSYRLPCAQGLLPKYIGALLKNPCDSHWDYIRSLPD